MEQTQSRQPRRVAPGWLVALVAAGALPTFACSQPTSPSAQSTHLTKGENVTPAGAATVRAENAAHVNPADLIAHGWSCRTTPTGDRIICSHPNQGFPVFGVPPPADRPASFTFLTFDLSGNFIGTEILIRSDLYNGQPCESTGLPYILRAAVGYYECVHTVGS
jgi:hypothetical protein